MFKRFCLILILLCAAIPVFADIPVSVRSKAEPTRVTLGEEIHYAVEVERPQKFTLEAFPEKLFPKQFEIKARNHIQEENGGHVKEIFSYTLITFELGQLKIPALPIRAKDPKGMTYDVSTNEVTIQSVSVGKVTEKSDIKPIKGPLSMSAKALYIALLVLGALIIAGWAGWMIAKRRKPVIDPETLKPAHERVLLELDRLKKKDYLSNHNEKAYYSELADILRRYLSRRYGFDTFDWTTAELVSELKTKGFETHLVGRIRELLEKADLVKFAKFSPPKMDAETLETELVSIVEATKETPEEKKK